MRLTANHKQPCRKTRRNLNRKYKMKIKNALFLPVFLLYWLCAMAAFAQTGGNFPTPPPSTNSATVQSGIQTIIDAVKSGQSNWYVIPYGLYAPGLQKRAGGGIAAMYPLSEYVVAGARLDYVNGGFWMPSGSATLQFPMKLTSWLTVTPFTYAGVGVPLSGATVSGVKLPGQLPRDNGGQATAILGYGGAVKIYTGTGFIKKLDAIADAERWTGFPGQQYRFGVSLKF